MTDKSRKTLPLAQCVWNVEGKKYPRTVPGISENEIAKHALNLSQMLCDSRVPDGETSNGSQKYRVMTPQEIAEQAIATAELMFSELEIRGHVVFLPPHDQWPNDSGPMGFTP
jgi:hypothetical protein